MNPDFLDLLRALLAANARFVVVGAYGVGVHGRPRATKYLDVGRTGRREPKVIKALVAFGAPLMGSPRMTWKLPGRAPATTSAFGKSRPGPRRWVHMGFSATQTR
jgi:hypothetical protein